MVEWWNGLTGVNQAFFIAAMFCTLLFVWQFISSVIGLTGGAGDLDVDADIDAGGVDDIEAGSLEDAAETVAAFKLLSIRAILAFCTLFAWAGALYLQMGKPVDVALLYAVGWGAGAFVVVTLLVNWLLRLAETGNPVLATCVGTTGSVYMDIPPDGQGKVRVKVSGAISMVAARVADGSELKAGTAVKVARVLDPSTVEVQPVGDEPKGKEEDQ